MSELIRKEAFKVIEGRPVTSSRVVADYFDKRHNDVLRGIRDLVSKKDELSGNFIEVEEAISTANGATRTTPVFMMDKKGFSILAMGFTGAKALDFKCAFYDEFERMEQELHPTIEQDVPEYLNPEQCWAIQSAVGKRARGQGAHFQTIYNALKAHFRVPKYTYILSRDFDEAIKFIQTCEIKLPVKEPAPAPQIEHEHRDGEKCPHCGLTPIAPDSIVLTAEEAKSLLSFIYCVRFLFRDVFETVFRMLQTTKSPMSGELWDAFHEVNWSRMLNILAKHGHDINDMPCYKHWLAGRRAA